MKIALTYRNSKYMLLSLITFFSCCSLGPKLSHAGKTADMIVASPYTMIYTPEPVIRITKPLQAKQDTPKKCRTSPYDSLFKVRVEKFMTDADQKSMLNIEWQAKYLDLSNNKGRERIEELDSLKYSLLDIKDSLKRVAISDDKFRNEWKKANQAQESITSNSELTNKITEYGIIALLLMAIYDAHVRSRRKKV